MEELQLNVNRLAINRDSWSLVEVTFSLTSGDILGLVGRSGSGKSTLIKALIGELHPSAGHTTFKKAEKEEPLNNNLGYSPQDHALYENLSVEENLSLFGQLRGMERLTIEQSSEQLLKRLHLWRARKKRITQLSGGMRKRADIAVALLHDPSVLILDEPITGLDVALQTFIWDLLKELAEKGKIIILTSHDLDEVEDNCTQYGLIREGYFYNTEALLARVKGVRKNVSEYIRSVFEKDANEEMKK